MLKPRSALPLSTFIRLSTDPLVMIGLSSMPVTSLTSPLRAAPNVA